MLSKKRKREVQVSIVDVPEYKKGRRSRLPLLVLTGQTTQLIRARRKQDVSLIAKYAR